MSNPLVWYDGQEGDIDRCALWDTLRRHGFVDGALQTQDADTLRRVDELADELFEEITASDGERQAASFFRATVEELRAENERLRSALAQLPRWIRDEKIDSYGRFGDSFNDGIEKAAEVAEREARAIPKAGDRG